MKTAQQNIALLPSECWGVLPVDKSLIRIKAGEQGYYPQKGDKKWLEDGLRIHGVKTTDELADILNADKGITIQQRKAMQWGSSFGWDTGLSNPERYDKKGNVILNKKKHKS